MATSVEQEREEVKQEITRVKDEIVELKDGLKVLEDAEERNLMQQRLTALQQQVAALQQQLAALQQKELLLMQQQPGTGGAASGLTRAELEDAVLCAIKKAKSDQVSISAFNATHWGRLSQQSGLRLVLRKSSELAVQGDAQAAQLGAFSWTDASEPLQADRYMPYLRSLISLSDRTSYPLVWLEAGSKHQNLLGLDGHDPTVYYSSIKGNTDAAIITRDSYNAFSPREGLCVLFELKKKISENAVYQAACELVVASLLSPSWRPVVVLTDLRNHWQLFWMNGKEVTHVVLPSQPAAVAVIKGCVHQAAQAAGAELPDPPALPRMLADRKEVDLAAGGPGVAVNPDLLDLQGVVSTEDMQDMYAQVMLRQVSMLPAFSTMKCKDAFASMFS